MSNNNAELERNFISRIDCRFPYHDRALSLALITEGQAISLNSAFTVLREICLKPLSVHITRSEQHELIEKWAESFQHPLKAPVLLCARSIVENQPLPWREAVSIMELIAEFDGQYQALGIACSSGSCDDDDGDTGLDAAYDRIINMWNERNAQLGDG
jgi:hypothetical protein